MWGTSCICWHSLRIQRKELGIGYSDISESDLDNLVWECCQENPIGGCAYIIGHLCAMHSLCIQCQHVIDSMNYINLLGQGMWKHFRKKKEWRWYQVPWPNALWHIDGHHKLILWGIVIHGITDGYSQKVCMQSCLGSQSIVQVTQLLHGQVSAGLRVCACICFSVIELDCKVFYMIKSITGLWYTDNTAETVLDMFIDAILEHGVPSRVGRDWGGENRDVSILMILLCSLNHVSFMWGPSVFNTQIERLWLEVGKQFVCQWHAFSFNWRDVTF